MVQSNTDIKQLTQTTLIFLMILLHETHWCESKYKICDIFYLKCFITVSVFFKCPFKKSYRMQLPASSLLLSKGRGKLKSYPTRYWQWLSTQQALKCFFKHLINVNSMPSPMTDVRDTAGKKSDVPALEEQITTTTKGERDRLKWAKEGCTNCVVSWFSFSSWCMPGSF